MIVESKSKKFGIVNTGEPGVLLVMNLILEGCSLLDKMKRTEIDLILFRSQAELVSIAIYRLFMGYSVMSREKVNLNLAKLGYVGLAIIADQLCKIGGRVNESDHQLNQWFSKWKIRLGFWNRSR